MSELSISEQRARDALSFDPMPQSRWVSVGDTCIAIKTYYSEPLSRFLRSLPGSKWSPEKRQWEFPFSFADALRSSIDELNRLAGEASERADKETERRKQEQAEWAERRKAEQHARQIKQAESRPRALRQEYLTPISNKPLYMIWLEAIGADTDRAGRRFGIMPRHAAAQVMGSNGRGGWTRAYLRGVYDYSRSNGIGSRGIMVGYQLEEGLIYWVASPVSWKDTERYFVRIIDGAPVKLEEEEVRNCLVR